MTTGPAALEARRLRGWVHALPWVVALALLATAAVRLVADRAEVAGPPPAHGAGPDALLTPAVRLDARTAARTALGTHGLAGAEDGVAADAWVLDLVLGRPTPTPTGAEVVVHATVITRSDDGWVGPTSTAVVVPLVAGPPAAVAGPAVPLATTDTTDVTDTTDRTATTPAEEHP